MGPGRLQRDGETRSKKGFAAQAYRQRANAVVVETGGGKGRSSCRRFFCGDVGERERWQGVVCTEGDDAGAVAGGEWIESGQIGGAHQDIG